MRNRLLRTLSVLISESVNPVIIVSRSRSSTPVYTSCLFLK